MTDAMIRAGTNHFPRAAQAAALAIAKVKEIHPLAKHDCESGWLARTILEAMRETAAGKTISSAAITAAAEGWYAIDQWARQRPTGTAINER